MRGFATALLDSEASAARSLLLAREQLQPTPKFEAIHAGLFMPLHEAVTRVAAIRREAPDSRDSILRAHAILGQAIVFAVAREALLRRLGAKRLTRAMVGEIADMVGKTAGRGPRLSNPRGAHSCRCAKYLPGDAPNARRNMAMKPLGEA